MVDTFAGQQWILIPLVFLAILGYFAWFRRKDQRFIEQKFGLNNSRVLSFGITFYGVSSDHGPVKKLSGFLLLLPDRLYFRNRRTGLELEIIGDKVLEVYHDVRHRGEEVHQSLMMVDFINEKGRRDTAAFHVPYPPQWIQAVLTTLKNKKIR